MKLLLGIAATVTVLLVLPVPSRAITPLPSCSYYRDGMALNLVGHLVTKELCRSLNQGFMGAGGGRALGKLGCGWSYQTDDELMVTITARKYVSLSTLGRACATIRVGAGWHRFQ